jgi:dihydrofolate reductase
MGENGMQINIIAACDRNSVIGINGKLPFRIKEDMQRFRELTLGHAVIMGRRTFESIGSKPLPHRTNIVVTGHRLPAINHTLSLQAALEVADEYFVALKSYIIGGEPLYTEALPLADRVYLTLVDTEVEVGPEHTVARFPLEQMQGLFRMESEDKRDGFRFTEWVKR